MKWLVIAAVVAFASGQTVEQRQAQSIQDCYNAVAQQGQNVRCSVNALGYSTATAAVSQYSHNIYGGVGTGRVPVSAGPGPLITIQPISFVDQGGSQGGSGSSGGGSSGGGGSNGSGGNSNEGSGSSQDNKPPSSSNGGWGKEERRENSNGWGKEDKREDSHGWGKEERRGPPRFGPPRGYGPPPRNFFGRPRFSQGPPRSSGPPRQFDLVIERPRNQQQQPISNNVQTSTSVQAAPQTNSQAPINQQVSQLGNRGPVTTVGLTTTGGITSFSGGVTPIYYLQSPGALQIVNPGALQLISPVSVANPVAYAGPDYAYAYSNGAGGVQSQIANRPATAAAQSISTQSSPGQTSNRSNLPTSFNAIIESGRFDSPERVPQIGEFHSGSGGRNRNREDQSETCSSCGGQDEEGNGWGQEEKPNGNGWKEEKPNGNGWKEEKPNDNGWGKEEKRNGPPNRFRAGPPRRFRGRIGGWDNFDDWLNSDDFF